MFTELVLLFMTILYGVCLLKLQKRIKELEIDVYCHLEGSHYPAIKNEFQTIWGVINEGDEDDGNC